MSTIIHHTTCPVCDSTKLKPVLSAKDYTVSTELFEIAECQSCTLRFTQNIPDEDSIGPYYKSENYISHSNTDKGFINQLYQSVRKKTLLQKRKLIINTTGLSRGNLLDVGSGTGAFANEMKQQGWQVTALEPDAGAKAVAKQLYGLELSDIKQLYQQPAGSFDAITLWHVLEHVHELHAYVQQLKLLLKPNGKIFIAVPNYTSTDATIYGEYWAAYDVPRHLYHFSPLSMQKLMAKHGLKVKEYKAMWYDSFYISMLSSKYKNGSTNLIAAFFNGLRSNFIAFGDVKKCSSVIYIID
ncbi:methyltransferase type 12 [Chitinophagaceae bacterium IBVUCB2]|nr:methyltransferase type 12 [Chitinophagaceae bacterium IBVUCB2]